MSLLSHGLTHLYHPLLKKELIQIGALNHTPPKPAFHMHFTRETTKSGGYPLVTCSTRLASVLPVSPMQQCPASFARKMRWAVSVEEDVTGRCADGPR